MVSLTCAKELSEKVRYKEDLPSLAQEHDYDLSAHKDSMLRHGLLISPSLTPLLEQRIVEVCENLGVPRDCISAFVHNSAEVQADCFIDTPTTCVLRFSSGLINLMDADEFKFVISHELGHFLLNHGRCNQYVKKSSSQDFIIRRAMEISADRIGFLGLNNLEKSLQAIIKTASGLDNKFLRFDIASFISQADLLSRPERGESSSSTHPSMLVRCRALLWFSMKVHSIKNINKTEIKAIDKLVEKDLEKFVDGNIRIKKRELLDDIVLWKASELIVYSGNFKKETQDNMIEMFGVEKVESLKSFFEMFSPEELVEEVSKKLYAALHELNENFSASAHQLEDEAFEKAYAIAG